jgi:type IV secretory pathway VirB4 component
LSSNIVVSKKVNGFSKAAEIRKTNGILFMAVQSAKTIFDNPTYQEMKDNISTYILYPNSKADAKYYVDELSLKHLMTLF